jgi:hypothetical protein
MDAYRRRLTRSRFSRCAEMVGEARLDIRYEELIDAHPALREKADRQRVVSYIDSLGQYKSFACVVFVVLRHNPVDVGMRTKSNRG